ncbi:MAG: methylenetetrahydrofolate reductase C-terminal domain-containing protein [Deltaproteobacteria bacterium]|jgi:ferredoxin|nr:methylenetetrahydrofolate reductase C-terminal domain-containing protein [Deltaproteobacteria bacterium]
MIIASRKPFAEIKGFVAGCSRILVAGCRGCVTVCNAGGSKEVEILASLLRLDAMREGGRLRADEITLERQCDPEYVEGLAPRLSEGYDAILSMACPVGPQFLAERFPGERVFPALNACFMGGALAHGVWAERCQACGDCVVHRFGGLCPVSRCAKSLLNGPCGGSAGGRCEVSGETECVWHLIVERMEAAGRLGELAGAGPAKDWSASRDGGPRKVVREELTR